MSAKIVTWVAVPDEELGGRSVTWHSTLAPIQLDGTSNIVAPNRIEASCKDTFERRQISRTSQLAPEIYAYADDRFCVRCTQPDLRIPEGWLLEQLPRQPDQMLLSTPSPTRYMVTIDFHLRGFRNGYSTLGALVGEKWNEKRKKYGGRGWKKQLVDDAVARLREVLK